MAKHIIAYHSNCMDGITSAFLLKQGIHKFNPGSEIEIVFVACQYGENYTEQILSLINAHPEIHIIYFTDFTPQIDEIEKVVNTCKRVIIYDHHKIEKTLEAINNAAFDTTNLQIYRDVTRSASLIVAEQIPSNIDIKLARYVSDRDTWKFELPNSREINEGLRMKVDLNDPMTLMNVLSFNSETNSFDFKTDDLIKEGSIIIKFRNGLIKSHIDEKRVRLIDNFHGFDIAVINENSFHSEIGNALSTKFNRIAVLYFILPDGKVVFSVRSIPELEVGQTANALCVKFGGGGHTHASGFSKDLVFLGEMLK